MLCHTLKAWLPTCRTIGLNQSEEGSHLLVQSLITHGIARQATALLQMFLTGTIKLSVHALRTLAVVFKYCNVPDVIETQQNVWQATSGQSSTRHALLAWLLPPADDVTTTVLVTDVELHSSVLVEVILRRRLGSQKQDRPAVVIGDSESIQDEFALSSFEDGLLVSPDWSDVDKEAPSSSQLLVDVQAKEKLFEAILEMCLPLVATKMPTPTRHADNLNAIMNLVDHTQLLIHVLSKILVMKIESWDNILQNR